MSFYSNTHSKIRVVSPEEILREELPLGDTFRLVFDESLDMIFRAKENSSDNNDSSKIRSSQHRKEIFDKCTRCCFIGTCRFDPYHHLKLRCDPWYRADGKDILFERVDWIE